MAQQRLNGRAAATMNKLGWLLGFALPGAGQTKPVTDIRPPEILGILRRIESRGNYETARRLRSTIGCVFRFAIATGRAEVDPTLVTLRGALARSAGPSTVRRSRTRKLLAPCCAPGMVLTGNQKKPRFAALKLMALLVPRPGELRAALWSESDRDARHMDDSRFPDKNAAPPPHSAAPIKRW